MGLKNTRLSIAVLRKRNEKGNLLYLGGRKGLAYVAFIGWVGEWGCGYKRVMGKAIRHNKKNKR